MKKVLLAIVAVFVTWSVLDFLLHAVLLGETYGATAQLWRAPEEMHHGLLSLVTLVAATCFVLIYAGLIRQKSIRSGIQFGLLYGIGAGVSAGYGMYAVMPIPEHLALSWFLGTVVEMVAAGLVTALIVRD